MTKENPTKPRTPSGTRDQTAPVSERHALSENTRSVVEHDKYGHQLCVALVKFLEELISDPLELPMSIKTTELTTSYLESRHEIRLDRWSIFYREIGFPFYIDEDFPLSSRTSLKELSFDNLRRSVPQAMREVRASSKDWENSTFLRYTEIISILNIMAKDHRCGPIQSYLDRTTSFEDCQARIEAPKKEDKKRFDPYKDNMLDLEKNDLRWVEGFHKEEKSESMKSEEADLEERLGAIARRYNLTTEAFLAVAEGTVTGQQLELKSETTLLALSWPSPFYAAVEAHVRDVRKSTGRKRLTVVGYIAEILNDLPSLEHLVSMPLERPIKPGRLPKGTQTSGKRRRLNVTVPIWIAERLDDAADQRSEQGIKKTSIIKALVEHRIHESEADHHPSLSR